MSETEPVETPRRSAAGAVAAGIFSSRIAGFIREVVIASFFGVGPHADVYRVAFRGPNVLQNLLGEGTISAAFIPIYSRMLEEGRREDAGRFAGAILGLLLVFVSTLVLLGILLAPYFVAVLTPGFVEDARGDLPPLLTWLADLMGGLLEDTTEVSDVNRFALTVQGVRLIFPMTGLLVLSAWALGVLNSHRRFFLPYFAPVLWNVAIIASLFVAAAWFVPDVVGIGRVEEAGLDTLTRLLFAAFTGALIGGALQFLVQLPLVSREMKGFRLSISTKIVGVREAVRSFWPVVAGRGAYQISTWIDMILASLIAAGAPGALGYAQTLYVLPISLFAMSVAASELPELSRIQEHEVEPFLGRLRSSVRQIMFLTVPAFVGYLCFGLPLIRALFERGRFGLTDSWLIYFILAAYTLGLLATTATRLLQNAFYALRDTRTPARYAVVRVVVATVCAVPLMFWLDRFPVAAFVDVEPQAQTLYMGAVGLALGATVGAWTELFALRRILGRRIGFGLPWSATARMLLLATGAALPAGLIWWLTAGWWTVAQGLVVVGVYGVIYLAAAKAMNFPEMEAWAGRFLQRFGGRSG